MQGMHIFSKLTHDVLITAVVVLGVLAWWNGIAWMWPGSWNTVLCAAFLTLCPAWMMCEWIHTREEHSCADMLRGQQALLRVSQDVHDYSSLPKSMLKSFRERHPTALTPSVTLWHLLEDDLKRANHNLVVGTSLFALRSTDEWRTSITEASAHVKRIEHAMLALKSTPSFYEEMLLHLLQSKHW
jgi:hypothetical protein